MIARFFGALHIAACAVRRNRRALAHLLSVLSGRAPLAVPHRCRRGHTTRTVPRAAAQQWALGEQRCWCGQPMYANTTPTTSKERP